jgi:hypothetical protein
MPEWVSIDLTISSLMVDTRTVTESASLCVPMKTDGVSCYSRFKGTRQPLFAGQGVSACATGNPQNDFNIIPWVSVDLARILGKRERCISNPGTL